MERKLKGYKRYQLQWMMEELTKQEKCACEEEWEDDEGTLLWDVANVMLDKKPYLNIGKHKDLIAVCVNEYDSIDEEYVFYIEKEWLYVFVQSEFGVHDVNDWLQNIYTSEESEKILFKGIEAGVVAGIYRQL